MGKIYKLSNGETLTVFPQDEEHFLKHLEENGLTATLLKDPSTEYDQVPTEGGEIIKDENNNKTTHYQWSGDYSSNPKGSFLANFKPLAEQKKDQKVVNEDYPNLTTRVINKEELG